MTKELREKYKLSVTKQLVYYDVTNGLKEYMVTDFYEKKIFSDWSILTIVLNEKITKNISSRFLKQMQSPDFVNEYQNAFQKGEV